MFTLLSFSLVIVLVVFFHELGHFLVARLFGVQVKAFSVGIGPKIISRTDKHGTEWKLCLLPLGGYVQMLEGEKTKNIKSSFENKTVTQRLLIVLAGPIASVALGWIIFFGIFSYHGAKEQPNFTIEGIGEVVKNSPAHIAGLQRNDVITKISFKDRVFDIKTFHDVYMATQIAGKTPMQVHVARNDAVKVLEISPRAVIDERSAKVVYRIGFMAKPLKVKKLTIGQSLSRATSVTVKSLTMIYDGLINMFKNGIGDEMGGPLKIAQVSGDAGRAGFEYLLGFIAMLSINLAVINMLPLPIMDGGRALFLCVEGIFRRPLPKKITETIMMASVWFMLLFFIFITLKDLGVL